MSVIVGAFAVPAAGAALASPQWLGGVGPAGVVEPGKGTGRIAKEPGRPRIRPRDEQAGKGSPADQRSWPVRRLRPRGSASARTRRRRLAWYLAANPISCRGSGSGGRSAFIVLMTSGNCAQQDPTEGREASPVRPSAGHRGEGQHFITSVHETTMDRHADEVTVLPPGQHCDSPGEPARSIRLPFWAKLTDEEPDAVIRHVRVCGG